RSGAPRGTPRRNRKECSMSNSMTRSRVDIPAVGICSFGRNEICTDLEQLDADVAILGVPYDQGTAYRAGARLAPRRIREASTLGNNEAGIYDHERDEWFLRDVKIVD